MSYESLRLSIDAGVALVTLDRPDELNAIDDDMRRDFETLAPQLTAEGVRVVVFTGAGRAFCAGGNVAHFEKDWNPAEFRRHSRKLSDFFDSLEELEKPVIAALNGPATGAGLQLAMACDLRIAGESARLGFREHRLGLIPGHGGATRLVKLVGLSRAKGLYFADDLVDAEAAREMGLVHRVVPDAELMEDVRRAAERLAKRAPAATGLTKQLLNAAANADLRRGLDLELLAQSVAIKTEDHREGVRAFREKRSPRFGGA